MQSHDKRLMSRYIECFKLLMNPTDGNIINGIMDSLISFGGIDNNEYKHNSDIRVESFYFTNLKKKSVYSSL